MAGVGKRQPFFFSFFRACLLSYNKSGMHNNTFAGIISHGNALSYLCSLSFFKQYSQGLFPNSSASSNGILSIAYLVWLNPSHLMLLW